MDARINSDRGKLHVASGEVRLFISTTPPNQYAVTKSLKSTHEAGD